MIRFIKYILNYKYVTGQIDQLYFNTKGINTEGDFYLTMCKAAAKDLYTTTEVRHEPK